MPRPSKPVSPDTLGGRIRAARQSLHLSLAQVAGQRYSTSLISQIERNRVEPSPDSLQYLAVQLHLPLDELIILAQLHRESDSETLKYRAVEEQRVQAFQLLENNQPTRALEKLKGINLDRIPTYLRWRLFALRGECSFKLRKFLIAQRDFLSAVAVIPETLPPEQGLEALTLRLHLAAATRELGQLGAAYVQFNDALAMMNDSTPLRFVAEAHWGLALVIYEQANNVSYETEHPISYSSQIQDALRHAEYACTLYLSIEDTLRAASLQCQIGLIEQATGNLEGARNRLRKVLDIWLPTLSEETGDALTKRFSLKERANAVSAAACYLASVELEANHCDLALEYVKLALEAGKKSYILRRAEAFMTYGRILETRNPQDQEAEEAFQAAIKELEPTDRIAAKIRAHDLLGRHYMKTGQTEKGDIELDQVRWLSHTLTNFNSATASDEDDLPK